MNTSASTASEIAAAKLRYSSILRCIGQSLETVELKSVEVKTHGDTYIVQAWNRGTSMAMDLEKHYSLEDICRLDAEGRKRRRPYAGPPNLLSLSQVLRWGGNYVDRVGGKLLRVSWQDQSDRIQSLTVQWETTQPGKSASDSQTITTVDELCIHIYKQRKKINLASERLAHRPFVSVGRVP